MRNLLISLVAVFSCPAAAVAHAAPWVMIFGTENGTPDGYVQVRENAIEGTPLGLRDPLGVSTVHTLQLGAIRRLGAAASVHVSLSATELRGAGTLRQTGYFNGVTLAPGPISSDTRYQDFFSIRASYWHKLLGFRHGGGLWASGGLVFVSLNFRIQAGIASSSTGHETKEDFNTQELPVPTLGLHLVYPVGHGFSVFAGIHGGHLPWTNSLRREGGMVQVTQTNAGARFGASYGSPGGWRVSLYLYEARYWQNERSGEDGNYVRLYQHGIGLAIADRL